MTGILCSSELPKVFGTWPSQLYSHDKKQKQKYKVCLRIIIYIFLKDVNQCHMFVLVKD